MGLSKKTAYENIDIPCSEYLITNNVCNDNFQEHRPQYHLLCFLEYLTVLQEGN